VPLYAGARGLEVWAIKRVDRLRHHAREIAFPGGKPDPGDRDLMDTAFRETEEELGISRDRLHLLGPLAPVPTATSRFTLNPFVALVEAGLTPENKVVLLDTQKRQLVFFNHHHGVEFEGLWLSSTRWIDRRRLALTHAPQPQQKTYTAGELDFL